MKTISANDKIESNRTIIGQLPRLNEEGLLKVKDTAYPEYAAHLLAKKLGLGRPRTELVQFEEDVLWENNRTNKGTIGLFLEELTIDKYSTGLHIENISDLEIWSRISYILSIDRNEWPEIIEIKSKIYLLDLEFTLPRYSQNPEEREHNLELQKISIPSNLSQIFKTQNEGFTKKDAIDSLKTVILSVNSLPEIFKFDDELHNLVLEEYYQKSIIELNTHLLKAINEI